MAHRKATTLAQCGARVRVVAPSIADDKNWPDGIEFVCREFCAEDTRDAFLVIAATDSRTTNEYVASSARARGALVQVGDDGSECDVLFPAILRRGDLCVAFSTDGAAPHFAAWLRDQAATFYREYHAEYCSLARELREKAAILFTSRSRTLLCSKFPVRRTLAHLSRGNRQAAREYAFSQLGSSPLSRHGGADEQQGREGKVFIVGAGPGDPDLVTVKAVDCLRQADTVLYDALVDQSLI